MQVHEKYFHFIALEGKPRGLPPTYFIFMPAGVQLVLRLCVNYEPS